MNIVAIIPARAGSKGVPNKNIRLLNGKPLICYSFENALNSKYINDVIVTTDSPVVEVLAKQKNIYVKKRSKELCKDDVTLDSVIFDAYCAFETKNYDLVITMQPTSPTLKAETLDKAIEYFLNNGLDTLISVINKPHLSWVEQDDKIIPNYVERLNRQYLPANYVETGAFVITKSMFVNEFSRFGKKIGVYPLPEEESIDIDDFNDFILASRLLKNDKVGFFVNGNNQTGLGHVYRVLELADEFYCKPDIIFNKNVTDKQVFGSTTHNLIPVDGKEELLSKCKKEQYSLFINDILSTSSDYMGDLRDAIPQAKIINFEDDGEGHKKADAVFNALLSESDTPNTFVGEKYYIASKLFYFYNPIKINEHVKNIFISFGGADPQNYSDRLLKLASQKEYSSVHFICVLGRAKTNVNELLKYNSCPNIDVYFDVTNMPELMSSCDIAITSRGRTSYELAFLGIPTLVMAQNEREEKHNFASNENGFIYIGKKPDDVLLKTSFDKLLNSSIVDRKEMQNKLLSHDLKNGRERIMKIIKSL